MIIKEYLNIWKTLRLGYLVMYNTYPGSNVLGSISLILSAGGLSVRQILHEEGQAVVGTRDRRYSPAKKYM